MRDTSGAGDGVEAPGRDLVPGQSPDLPPATARRSAWADLVAGVLDLRDDPATRRFDAELADAVAAGDLDEDTARTLRWWQRASVRAVVEHAATVIPGVAVAVEEARAGATRAVTEQAAAWERGRLPLGPSRDLPSIAARPQERERATERPAFRADVTAEAAVEPAAETAPEATGETAPEPAAEAAPQATAEAATEAATEAARPPAVAATSRPAVARPVTASASSASDAPPPDPGLPDRRRLVVAGLTAATASPSEPADAAHRAVAQ